MKLQFLKKVKSTLDSTQKFIFKTTQDNLIIEYSYINKNDGKNIICIPSQTMCNLGCKFCHTQEYIGKIKCRNLTADEIYEGIEFVYNDLHLDDENKVLLVSFMGCGEPILNVNEVIDSMIQIKKMESKYNVSYIRFAVATSIPKSNWSNFFEMTEKISSNKLPVKLHLSLHYTIDALRKE
jgi:23S rRNA (adenine2503-C2)-methyltransferase